MVSERAIISCLIRSHLKAFLLVSGASGESTACWTVTYLKLALGQKPFFQLVKQMAEQEDVTEQLKAEHQMEWVGRMNGIRNCAEEIIYNELVYA